MPGRRSISNKVRRELRILANNRVSTGNPRANDRPMSSQALSSAPKSDERRVEGSIPRAVAGSRVGMGGGRFVVDAVSRVCEGSQVVKHSSDSYAPTETTSWKASDKFMPQLIVAPRLRGLQAASLVR